MHILDWGRCIKQGNDIVSISSFVYRKHRSSRHRSIVTSFCCSCWCYWMPHFRFRQVFSLFSTVTLLWIRFNNNTNNNVFQPVLVENLGPFSSSTLDFLRDLGRRISHISGDDREVLFLFQRISVTIQRIVSHIENSKNDKRFCYLLFIYLFFWYCCDDVIIGE